MSTIIVVQARMGSSRLPGKVLANLGGVPALRLMLERLRPLPEDVLVATTTNAGDDPIAELADQCDVAVVRGSEDDVLARFMLALHERPADTVVRLTADCPLVDPSIVQTAVATHLGAGADYTSNTLIRTYPDGLDVEVISSAALSDAAAEAVDPAEREHVTPFVYRRPERYRLAAFWTEEMAGDERWTLDTEADLEFLQATVARLADPFGVGWRDVLELVGRRAAHDRASLCLQPDLQAVDPGARAFVIEQGGVVRGKVMVPVTKGVGRVEGDVDAADKTRVLELLEQALRADYQVQELVPGPLG